MGNYSILKMSFFQKYKYFSSFEAGNCIRNSSFERMNDKNHNSAVGLPEQKLSSMFMFPEGYVIIKVKKWLFCIAVPRGGGGLSMPAHSWKSPWLSHVYCFLAEDRSVEKECAHPWKQEGAAQTAGQRCITKGLRSVYCVCFRQLACFAISR